MLIRRFKKESPQYNKHHKPTKSTNHKNVKYTILGIFSMEYFVNSAYIIHQDKK
jgi:hypothetical protein